MPIAELVRAGEELVAGLARVSPGIRHSIDLLEPGVPALAGEAGLRPRAG
ncbi:MAG: hypothetical protein ABSF64_30195 [Bryobacteraceae bacterium]|jgi:hypothetical protein